MQVMSNPTINYDRDLSSFPKITIITPCYNHVDFIEATILSILEQGYPNLEYVIMDGGSTDGSVQIIEKYDSYLAYWQSKRDGGQYESINEGFGRTSGEIMAWLNSDDMLHRNALWTVAEIFNKFSQVEWLMGNPSWFDAKGRTVSVGQAPIWSRYRILYGEWKWIQQESVFWRRSLWEKADNRLETKYKYAADFELWVRLFRYAQLYTTTALTGGFRSSSKNQKGRINRDKYFNEVNQIISEGKKTFFPKHLLLKNKLLSFLIKATPRWLNQYLTPHLDDFYKCPPLIVFNQQVNEFQLQKKN